MWYDAYMRYEATNYSMGRAMSTIKFEAYGFEAARKYAEKNLPGKHAQAPNGTKVAVIGIRRLDDE